VTSIDRLAEELVGLRRDLTAATTTPQLAYSSIDNGALRATDDTYGETMRIGRQWDGTYAPGVTTGPLPPTPAGLSVLDATEGIVVFWDGTFIDLALVPMDFLRVDIHVGATSDFLPSHANRRGTFAAATGGSIPVTLPYGTYFVKLVCWTLAGKVSLASAPVEGDAWPIETGSDGFAPDASPDPMSLSLVGASILRWPAILNADPVTYDVHLSTTLGFTADSTTKVGETQGTQFTLKRLPGPDPVEGEEDPYALQYDATYYARIVARDADGAAPQSLQAVVAVFRVTGVDIAADSISAINIQAQSLTGELFAANVIVSNTFKTADSGQRVEWGAAGIQGYLSDGTLMMNFPVDGSRALFDGELVIRKATVVGGMSIQSSNNQLNADSAFTLNNGIVEPSATPQFQITWDTVQPSTATLTSVQKTGPLGTFDLVPSDVTFVEFKPTESPGGTVILFQARPDGTRAWFFNTDGTPKDRTGGGNWFNDESGNQIWSTVELKSTDAGASAPGAADRGVYKVFRYVGGSSDWWLSGPRGFNKLTPLNPAGTPVIGSNDGANFFIAETVPQSGAQHKLVVKYYSNMTQQNNGDPIRFLPAPSSTWESTTGYAASLCAMVYHPTAFDISPTGPATHRYATAERGVAYSARLVYLASSGIFPGVGSTAPGVGGWGGSGVSQESWESPTSNRRGMFWNPNNSSFYTYGGDGFLYRHTSNVWDAGVSGLSKWNGKISFWDSVNSYETLPGTPKQFTMYRRAKLIYTPPTLPPGVTHTKLFLAWGNAPANTDYHRQDTTATQSIYSSMVSSGQTPLTSSTFPNGNPAKFINVDESLRIDATGLVRAVTLRRGAYNAAIEGPRWYGALTADTGVVTASTWSNVSSWVAEAGALGITNAAGLLTIPVSGRYRITTYVTWQTNTTGTSRGIKVMLSGIDLLNKHANVHPLFQTVAEWPTREVLITAGQTLRVAVWHNATASLVLRGNNTAGAESIFQVEYVGP
jgi:hypothetical protein